MVSIPPRAARSAARTGAGLASLLVAAGVLCSCNGPVRRPAPGDDELRSFRAVEAAALEGGARALERAEEHLARWPDGATAPRAHLFAGLAGQSTAATRPRAVAHFRRARELGDAAVRARAALQLGYVASLRGDDEMAVQQFRAAAAAAVDPETEAEAELELGRAWIELGRPDEARAPLSRAAACTANARFARLAQVALAGIEEAARGPAPGRALARGFAVQIGVFVDAANARRAVARAERAGFAARIIRDVDGGTVRYRVACGGCADRAAALALRERVHAALGGERPVVIP